MSSRAIGTTGSPIPALHLPDSAIVSRDEALRLNPVVAPEGVTGGAVWYDYQMHSTDRVTFSFLLSAAERGAAAANYVAGHVGSCARTAASPASSVEDKLTGETFDDSRHASWSTPPGRGPRACWQTCRQRRRARRRRGCRAR